jgi:hypothetical protein
MKRFCVKLDQLSSTPDLLFSGNKRFTTLMGTFMTIVCYLASLGVAIYIIQDWIFNSKPLVVVNFATELNERVDVSSYPFAFVVMNGMLQPLPDSDRIYSVEPIYGDSEGKVSYSYPLQKCDPDKHFGKYKSLVSNISYLANHYCLPADASKSDLRGSYGSANELNINIDFTKCINGTNNDFLGTYRTNVSNCQSADELEKSLNEVYIQVLFIDTQINNDNDEPRTSVLKKMVLPASSSLFKRYFLYQKLAEYTTDKALLGKDPQSIHFHQYDFKDISLDLSQNLQKKFAQVTFTLSGNKILYYRSYAKIQQIIASVGSIYNLFYIISIMTVQYFSAKLFYNDLINKYFIFDTEKTKKGIDSISTLPLRTNTQAEITINRPNNGNSFRKRKEINVYKSLFCPKNNFKEAVSIIKQKISIDNLLVETLKLEKMREILLSPQQKLEFDRNLKHNFHDSQHKPEKGEYITNDNNKIGREFSNNNYLK